MGRTKIVGPAGKYGVRYGVSVRKKVRDILLRKNAKHTCPFCGAKGKTYRISIGIWKCRKCRNTWAGGAYTQTSGLATYLKKIIVKEWT